MCVMNYSMKYSIFIQTGAIHHIDNLYISNIIPELSSTKCFRNCIHRKYNNKFVSILQIL